MPLRNLSLLLLTVLFSVICFIKAPRNRYGATVAEGIAIVSQDGLEKVESRELFERAMGAITDFDLYTEYIPPEYFQSFQESLDQKFAGIGIELDPDAERLTVLTPVLDSPAHRAGVRSGDVILSIEGRSTEGMKYNDASLHLRGNAGSKVRIRVEHDDHSQQDITITREIIPVESVKGDYRDETGHWRFVLEAEPRIGLIRVLTFGEETTNELKNALSSINGKVDGLIIDLRSNAGGLLTASVDACDMFLEKGVVVTTRGRDKDVRSRYDATPDTIFSSSVPIVILTNRDSASASEIMAACLQDHGRAIVVGERTFGKGTVQNIYPLEGGRSAIKLTVASYWRPSGKNIHKLKDDGDDKDWGVRPNPGMEVSMSEELVKKVDRQRRHRDIIRSGSTAAAEVPENEDIQLKRAIDYLQSRLGPSEG